MLFNLRYTLGLLQTTASWGHESRPGGAAQHMWLQNLHTSGSACKGTITIFSFLQQQSWRIMIVGSQMLGLYCLVRVYTVGGYRKYMQLRL